MAKSDLLAILRPENMASCPRCRRLIIACRLSHGATWRGNPSGISRQAFRARLGVRAVEAQGFQHAGRPAHTCPPLSREGGGR